MHRITITLLRKPDLGMAVLAARTCYNSFDKASKDTDGELLKRLWKLGHHSVFEHCYYTFKVENCSRACLQEIVRHRIASYSVQSTRFTLKKLINEANFEHTSKEDIVTKYCVIPLFSIKSNFREHYINEMYSRLCVIKEMARHLRNDELKYYLPESWRTQFAWTINLRSLANFLNLRLASQAHFEIRRIANKIVMLLDDFIANLII